VHEDQHPPVAGIDFKGGGDAAAQQRRDPPQPGQDADQGQQRDSRRDDQPAAQRRARAGQPDRAQPGDVAQHQDDRRVGVGQRHGSQRHRRRQRVGPPPAAQVARHEQQEGQGEDQGHDRGVVRVHVGGQEACPQQAHQRQNRTRMPRRALLRRGVRIQHVLDLVAEVPQQPDQQQGQHRRRRELDHVQADAQPLAEVGRQRREAGRVQVLDLRVEGGQRGQRAAFAQHQGQVAEALGVRVQRDGQHQQRRGEQGQRQGEEGQLPRARPAQPGGLPPESAPGQRAAQEDADQQGEPQAVDRQRVPAEERRQEQRPGDHHRQNQRRRQADARGRPLADGRGQRRERRGQHRPRAEHHRPEDEKGDQPVECHGRGL